MRLHTRDVAGASAGGGGVVGEIVGDLSLTIVVMILQQEVEGGIVVLVERRGFSRCLYRIILLI